MYKLGYAGGSGKFIDNRSKKDLVCYHNLQGLGDYGKLGYSEVVQVTIPSDRYGDFAKEYFSLFGSDGDRPDKGDRGPEYRSLVGLPGGVNSPLYPALETEAKSKGIFLKEGNGNDKDTLVRTISLLPRNFFSPLELIIIILLIMIRYCYDKYHMYNYY